MGNKHDVFIVQHHKPLHGVQVFAAHLIPRPETIIGFMGNTHLLIHIDPARFISIFQQVNNDSLKGVLLLFQFGNGIFEHFPCKGALCHAPLNLDVIADRDVRRVHVLNITVSVEHKRIRERVGKSGLAAERCAINPQLTLVNLFNVAAFVFGENHKIPSFLAKILILTESAQVRFCFRELCCFVHRLYRKQKFNYF